jgi:uncharacterized RDD family membrane protein YckC
MPPAASDGPASSRATSSRTPATSQDVTLQSGTLQSAAPARAKANRGNEAWRAEVANRVSNYRARQQQSGELFPGQDFSSPPEPTRPVAEAPAASEGAVHGNHLRKSDSQINDVRINDLRINDTKPHEDAPPKNDPARKAEAVRQARSARVAARRTRPFDTDYYRRQNAAVLNAPAVSMGSNALFAAIAPEANVAEAPEADVMVESSPEESGRDFFDLPGGSAATGELPELRLRPESKDDSALEKLRITEAEAAPEVLPVAPAPVQPEAVAPDNLIVFHRPLIEPPLMPRPSEDELAEPVNRRPRILEVPEDMMPTVQGSLFAEIHLDPIEVEAPSPRAEIEVPLPVAEIGDRLLAGLTDVGIVLAGGVLFSAGAWMALPDVPHTKPFFLGLAVVTVALWVVYQHLFLMGAGQTPGMKLRGLRLSTFDGRAPEWSQRSSRAHFACISMASATLGFLWAYVDQDMLCWHDHVSRTFPTVE